MKPRKKTHEYKHLLRRCRAVLEERRARAEAQKVLEFPMGKASVLEEIEKDAHGFNQEP